MKLIYLILIVILTLPIVSGATLQGTIYDLSFNKAQNTIITINTSPIQTKVLENGNYQFEVKEGTYLISANKYQNNILVEHINQTIIINSDGRFILDLILYPIEQPEEFIDINDYTNLSDYFNNQTDNQPSLIKLILVLLLGFLIITSTYMIVRKTTEKVKIKLAKRKTKHVITKEELDKYKTESEKLEKDILEFINEQNTTSQLDIRTKFPQYSEAKISLIITKLESENKIKKIKHGRANIISKV